MSGIARTSRKASGIVIRRHPLPDGDLILTLFCPDGKRRLIARAGANTLSRTVSRLNLFQNLSVQYLEKPGDTLGLLTQTTLEGALPRLSEPQLYPLANLLCELCDLVWQEGQEPGSAFALLAGALRGLSSHPDPDWVALVLAFKLLGASGHAPQLEVEAGEALPSYFDPLSGRLSRTSGVRVPEGVSLFLTEVYNRTVRELMDFSLEGEERALLWRLLERFCSAHVGPLRSWLSLDALVDTGPRAEVGSV